MKKINLGCGCDHLEGYINVDIEQRDGVDLIHNIEYGPLPFKCDEILANDLLEHLTPKGLLNIVDSLVVGGLLHGKVPHYMYRGAYADFQHQRWISSETFASTWWLQDKVDVEKIVVRYSFFGVMWSMPNWFVRVHEKMFPGIFPPAWVVFRLRKKKRTMEIKPIAVLV